MRALTVRQPYASLLIVGAKTVETRGWDCRYRGVLAVHAAGRLTVAERELCDQPFFREGLAAAGISCWQDLPLGCVLGLAELVRTSSFTGNEVLTDQERAFGDFAVGRYGWVMERPRRLAEPIPTPGALGLWHWTPSVAADLERVTP